MKKRAFVFLLVIFLMLSVSIISAQSTTGDDAKVAKAYTCLENKVKDKCSSISDEERAFTALAIGKCVSDIESAAKDNECWPKDGCDLKDTALSLLALRKSNKDTDKIESWLLNQTESPTDLIWYLEIDSDVETKCKISYADNEYEVTVKEDKKLSSSAGACLSADAGGYWLKIDNDCYDYNFTISCDQEFLTTLLYMKRTGSTVYVSSKTNFGASQGRTTEQVNSLCFGVNCDYEGSLWATLALSDAGYDVSPYVPYLIAMADENEKYFPSSYLYIITAYDDFFNQIIELNLQEGYWKIKDSPYSQFYDTALGILSLKATSTQQGDSAKSYLLSVQGVDGCWNNVRDTAFILYAAWAKSTAPIVDTVYCEDYDKFCVSSTQCDAGNRLDYTCRSGAGKVCCKEEYKEKTCADKGGELCERNEECTGTVQVASDSTSSRVCCSGTCEVPVVVEYTCEEENENYTCKSSCNSTDISKSSYTCENDYECCAPPAPAPKPEKSYWWIWVLIILIILVALAIVFRDRLRVFIFSLQNKMKKGPGSERPSPGGMPPGRFPPGPPIGMQQRPRMILPGQQPQPPMRPMPTNPMQPPRPTPGAPQRPQQVPGRRPAGKSDKDLDETLRKLKEMSK